jgi:DNA polymerase-4
LLPAEPEKYREVHRAINKIFDSYSVSVEPYSVDESFLDFRGSKLNPLVIGAEIKQRIRQEVGEWLTCSVGIAPNKFMAKLAADLKKPDGLSVIWRENLPEIYKHKKLSDLWGIGRGWTKRLARLGIETPIQLMDYPVANLMQLFGKPGFYLWQRVNGLENEVVEADDVQQKSFGNSWVLNFRTTDREQLKPVIFRLAEKAARRMRQEGFAASSIYFHLRLANRESIGASKRLKFQVATGQELYEEALKMWETWKISSPVMHMAVGFSGLAPKVHQLSFWSQDEDHLTPALDQINDKYGEFTVRPGLIMKSSDYAPDSIAFGQ